MGALALVINVIFASPAVILGNGNRISEYHVL
ncbi:hypothetical protein Xets_03173 [Xenorhabdus sp. TS4]|uniref:Uncharacterized protein n=1 Tax=Xenorhabdus ehlersii TaxID=290111 RepID=A0A2D0IWJ3_9GAMM|nr:hypothetical protein [Xenorhabdus sp. TS4]PHM26276.1 hypothetical protein Xehl_00603 [Xenorhabdus ehlersii]